MLGELTKKCPKTRKILREEAGIVETNAEIQSIIVEKEYPFSTEIWYKVKNKEGKELYLNKNVMGMVYLDLIDELLNCEKLDEKIKEQLKREKEELEKSWNEYIRDP